MPTYVIPTETGPDTEPQVLRTTLDGQVFQLSIRYNTRAAMWRMDLLDDSGAALAAGLSLRNAGIPANGALLFQRGYPQGMLAAVPSDTSTEDAGLEELGARVLLTYRTQAGG